MIPDIEILTSEITTQTYPNRTYKIQLKKSETGEYYGINDYVEGVDALIQTVSLILSTERYRYLIYSWDYGIELLNLIGQPMSYVMAEIPRRVTEALKQDDRITDVVNFTVEKHGRKLHTTFTIVSTVGNIPTEMEVDI